MISNKDKKIFDWMDHYHLFIYPNEHTNQSYAIACNSRWKDDQFIITKRAMASPILRELYGYRL